MSITTPDLEWREDSRGLVKTFTFPSFPDAVAFVVAVARLAETMQHHPDIDIRWNKITLRLTTHDAGSTVTAHDHQLAARIDLIAHPTLQQLRQQLFPPQ